MAREFSKTTLKDMRAGLLAAYKNGKRTILFYDDLDRYMRRLPRAKFRPVDNAGREQSESGEGADVDEI